MPSPDVIRYLRKYDIGAVFAIKEGNDRNAIELIWKFAIDLSRADNGELELITTPVTAQSYSRFEPHEVIPITSFVLRPLSATIKADTEWVPSFSDNVDNLVYVVMKDGTRVQLVSQWGSVGVEHLNAESPIVLEEVDHVLLPDGTKIAVP